MGLVYYNIFVPAGVMELVDVVDSKSTASDGVPVRVRSPAPQKKTTFVYWTSVVFFELSVPYGTTSTPSVHEVMLRIAKRLRV